LILWAIVKLPTPLFMFAVKIMGRIKKIIWRIFERKKCLIILGN
jgi:hypothetical protein